MANIIISESAKNMPATFGELSAPIAEFITRRDQAYQAESIASKIFVKKKSTHRLEAYGGYTAANDWEPVGEGESHPTNGFEEGYTKVVSNVVWKSEFDITREAVDDDQIGELQDLAGNKQDSYERTRERFFARLLGEAVKGNSSFKLGKFSFDTTGADGKVIFAKDHAPKITGNVQSNLFAGEFSVSNLAKAQTAMQNFRGDNGEILALTPDTIIIPNLADLKTEVFGVLGANFDPSVAGGNKYNYLFGNFNVIVWPYLNEFIKSGTAPWILMDSSYMKKYPCAIEQERVGLEWKSTYDENHDINRWLGYARFTGAFVDFRGLCACGVTGGSTL